MPSQAKHPPHPSPQLRVGKGFQQNQELATRCHIPPDAFPVSPRARRDAHEPADHPAPSCRPPWWAWGGRARHPAGFGGPWQGLAPPRCKQENGRMKIARAGSRAILAPAAAHRSPTTSDCGPRGSWCPLARAETPYPPSRGCCDAGFWHRVGTHHRAAPHPAASPGHRRSGRRPPATGRCPRGR